MDETITVCVEVRDLNPNSAFNINFDAAKLLKKLLGESRLPEEKLEDILKCVVDADLPIRHAELLVDAGANVNRSFAGVDKLLRIAYTHIKKDHTNGDMFNFLLKSHAVLNEKEQDFYKDVDPKFLQFYKESIVKFKADPGKTLHSKAKLE